MKKIFAILLSIVILLPSIGTLFVSAAETNDYTSGSIVIDCHGTSFTVKVFVTEDDTILIPVDILEVCGGMDCRVEGSEYIYFQGSSSVFERQVRIDKNGFYGKTGIQTPHKGYLSGVSINFCDSYTNNGYLFLPLHELAPFLDAQIEITDDGILHIYPNPVSIFTAITSGPYNDLDTVTFDVDNVIGGNFIGATGMILDSILNLRFDRLDIIFNTGATKDYKKLFEKILIENDTYLSAFDEEETPSDKAFNVIYDSIDEGNEFMEAINDTYLDNTAKALEYMMGSNKFEKYKEFSDELDRFDEYAKAVDLVYNFADYINVLTNMVEDHENMLLSVYGKENLSPTPACIAANEVAHFYSDNTAGVITSFSVSALRDYLIKAASKPIIEKITPWAIAFDVVTLALPKMAETAADSANIFYLDAIVSDASESFNDCYRNITFDKGSIEDIRLSLIMTLVSSKYAYDLYYGELEDELGVPGSGGGGSRGNDSNSIEWKQTKINEWLEKLYLAADSVECSTPEYYSKTKKELFKTVGTLKLSSSTTPDNPKYSRGLEFTLFNDGKSYSVTGIGTCTDTNIIIPDTYGGLVVTSIGDYAFTDCDTLTSITIPDSITSIGYGAFAMCDSLTSIIVDKNNTVYQSIDGNLYSKDGKTLVAYASGKNDTSFTIPDNITSVGEWAFAMCDSLTSIIIPDSVTSIGNGTFCGCSALTSIVVDKDNAVYQSIEGNLYSKDGKTLVAYASGKNDTSFTIPDSVTSIGMGAFTGCNTLTSIIIPDSVTSIGEGAFNHCIALTSVRIPDSVTSIGESTFGGCTSLTNVTIPNSVTSIGGWAFQECTSLTSITIPNSVTSIDDYAFSLCPSLTSVTIPDSVTSIGYAAFWNCTSLTSVTFNGTVAQWNAISFVGDSWNPGVPATEVICSDGVVSLN